MINSKGISNGSSNYVKAISINDRLNHFLGKITNNLSDIIAII